MQKSRIVGGLAVGFAVLVFANILVSTDAKKSSKEQKKLDEDKLRASLGTIRDTLVKYVSNPSFAIISETIIDTIIVYLSEMDTEDLKEVFTLLQGDPALMDKLNSELKNSETGDEWSDPEKAYELIRNAFKTFSDMEHPQAYFKSLIKIIGMKTKEIIGTPKDEL